MGCGKSSVGKELSTLLSLPVVDLDTFIENSAGRTIPEIFTTDGEPAFRTMELSALRRLLLPLSRSMCTQPAINVADNTATNALSGTPGSTALSHTPAVLTDCSAIQTRLPHNDIPYPAISQSDSTAYDPAIPQSAAIPDGPADFILSLGGGTLTTPGCVELIREKTFCIYLQAGIDTLVRNLQNDTSNRPMLSSAGTASATLHPEPSRYFPKDSYSSTLRDRIETLMSCRSKAYESTARLIIDIDGKSFPAVASEIASRLPDAR